MNNKNNGRVYRRNISIFEANEWQTAGTKLQLLFVLSCFISSMSIAIVLAEGPKKTLQEVFNRHMPVNARMSLSKVNPNNQ